MFQPQKLCPVEPANGEVAALVEVADGRIEAAAVVPAEFQ